MLRYWPGLFHIFSLLFCLRCCLILKNCQLIQTKFSLNEVNYDFFSLRPRTNNSRTGTGPWTWGWGPENPHCPYSETGSRTNKTVETTVIWQPSSCGGAWLRLRRHYWRHYWLHNSRLYTCWKPKRPQQVMAVGLKKVVSSIAENIFTQLRRKSG